MNESQPTSVTGETRRSWMSPAVAGIGAASLLSDLGHEVPTSLLPAFLTSTLGAPAAALGLIEGIADGFAGAARLFGGALADDPAQRRATATGGYTATALFSSAIGLATRTWHVGVVRAAAWTARGLRVPARNALLADAVPANAYGRAYGFERAMDNLGAIGGPLLALALVAAVGTRSAIVLSVIPGLLATGAILYAIRKTPKPSARERQPLRIKLRPVLRGPLGVAVVAMAAFEFGNPAATLLLLRTTQLLGHGTSGTKTGLLLYAGYNASATLVSIPIGRLGDRLDNRAGFALGIGAFAVAYAGFAVGSHSVAPLAILFALAGIGIGCVETAEHATVAQLAPPDLRGSAFGLLAAVQSFGNLAASAVAGVLWSAASARTAFTYLTAWMVVAAVALLASRSTRF